MDGFHPDRTEFYRGDPHAAFRLLRARDPVHWYESGGFWCVLKYEDLRQVSRRPGLFCSSQGTQLFEIVQRRQLGAPPPELPRAILQMDPPEHRRLRRLVVAPFTPRRIKALEPRVRALARAVLAPVESGSEVDFVEAVAAPLPLLMIAELLGVPASDREDFRRWTDAIVEVGGAESLSEGVKATVGELFGYFREKLAERRRRPSDDLMSQLLAAEIEGERLDEPAILMLCLTLLVAGNETTRNLIAGGALALVDHPPQLRQLQRSPRGIPNAIEEMLRWWTPVQTFVRRATAKTRLRDRTIEEGDYVVLFYGSANRDEEVFGDAPDVFDVTRKNAASHVAFGFGEHLCLGAALARLEARVLFEELLGKGVRIERNGAVDKAPSVLMNAIERMPVVFRS